MNNILFCYLKREEHKIYFVENERTRGSANSSTVEINEKSGDRNT